MSTGARAHCWLGSAVAMLAAVSSGIGERQGRVKELKKKMGAWFGKVRQLGQRPRMPQRHWRVTERVIRMPTPLDERGHPVNSGIRLS